jgi:UV DNA damage endonuclease
MAIWHRRGIKPKSHWSEQDPTKRRGAHGILIETLPIKIRRLISQWDVDVCIESKAKEKSVLNLYKKFFGPAKRVTGRLEWGKIKLT